MDNYKSYHTEDFVLDAKFQKWIRYQDADSAQFWNDFRERYPQKVADIETASILLQGVYLPGDTTLSEEEIRAEILGLISEIQTRKSQRPQLTEPNHEHEVKIVGIRWWLSAASIALISMLAFWYVSNMKKELPGVAQLESGPVVEKFNRGTAVEVIRLEDGSTIELAPGSMVNYSRHFGNLRKIHLSGEALFRVAKDAERPFLVYANNLVTRVLGTTFTVRSFKDAKESTVEVQEGRVSVYKQADFELSGTGSQSLSKGIVLTANQKIVFQKDGDELVKSLVDVPKVVPSIKSQPDFVYRNTPIGEVLTDIEHAYQVDIIFDEEQLKDCPVTATLINQSLLEKIEIICETIEARFEVLDGQIVVYGKKCTE